MNKGYTDREKGKQRETYDFKLGLSVAASVLGVALTLHLCFLSLYESKKEVEWFAGECYDRIAVSQDCIRRLCRYHERVKADRFLHTFPIANVCVCGDVMK